MHLVSIRFAVVFSFSKFSILNLILHVYIYMFRVHIYKIKTRVSLRSANAEMNTVFEGLVI